MKSILLIRHAKSSWDFDVEDFDRPLNNRGSADAAEMAKRLIEKNIKIDAFISSPAKRALSTAGYFAKAYNEKDKNIITTSALYEPAPEVFYNEIDSLDDKLETVAFFSHNPGITDFVNQVSPSRIDDMPTCAIFALKADIKKWKDFSDCNKQFWFFDYPKSV